jgi:hypothetical protein
VKRWNYPCTLIVLGVLTYALMGATALAQPPQPVPGASGLAGTLVQHHGYLFNDDTREAVDALNRALREAERTMERGQTVEAKAQAAEARGARATELIRLLDASGVLVDLRLPETAQTLPKLGPVDLPGDSGALFFRVNPDAGNPQCIVAELNFAGGLHYVAAEGLDPARTNYVLVSLRNVPQRMVSIRVDFAAGDKRYELPVDIQTPAHGRLLLTVLSDDTGRPAPAMMRLVWKDNGSEYKPRNALDFTSQFDSQSGRSTGLRNANLHGKLAGNYWCVPGPLDMTLPPGEWEVVIRRGTEHLPIIDTFTVPSGGVFEKTYRPERWTDLRKSGWYSGDDHVHFQILSEFDAEQLMTWLQAEDVHLGNALKMGDMYRTWFEQRGFGPDFRVQDGDYIIVPGQECPRTHDELGHTISLNLTDMVRDTSRYYQYDWIFENVAAQGGLSGFAHVNSGIFQVHRGMTLVAPKGLIDFVELLQFANLGTDLYYDFLNLGFKVTASAGSDVPWGGTVGEVRAYAYTGRGQFTADKWFDALERGRTFVTNGPMIDFRVDRAFPGDELHVEAGDTVRVRARTWGATGFTTPVKLEIIQHGDVIHSVEAGAEVPEELELDINVDPGGGCWLAARVEGTEGYRAHTTPVYVVREGLRFWKYSAVTELLGKRNTSLDEIEGVIASALERQQQGTLGADKMVGELALQAEALRARVQEARATYADLAAVHAAEAALRK